MSHNKVSDTHTINQCYHFVTMDASFHYFLVFFSVLSNSYHERLSASLAGLTDDAAGTNDLDENSLENIPTTSQSNNLSNEGSLLQSVIDKNTIVEAQEIIASLQVDGQNNNDFNDIIKTDPDSCVSSNDDIDEFEDEMNSFSDGTMLPERDVIFNLQAPSFVPNYLNMHYVCETGSRILLLSICWFKKFHAFNLLR